MHVAFFSSLLLLVFVTTITGEEDRWMFFLFCGEKLLKQEKSWLSSDTRRSRVCLVSVLGVRGEIKLSPVVTQNSTPFIYRYHTREGEDRSMGRL